MAKTKNNKAEELGSVYFLKLVLYVVIGSQWLWLINPGNTREIPLPVGLLIGLWFASHEHFQIDKKIEYAVLLIATFIGFWAQMGVYAAFLK